MPTPDRDSTQCTVRYDTGRCPNAATEPLPLCGPCLGVMLSEPDPGRRRALAGLTRLPDAVVARLAGDPDAGVRARVATRDDVDAAAVSRFADPALEPSPAVWRSLAATRLGAVHAATLLTTGDRLTLLILATNPVTAPEILERLAQHPDPEIAATVAATRAGRPPDGTVISQVLEARSIPTRPIATAPPGTAWPGRPEGPPASSFPPGPPEVPTAPLGTAPEIAEDTPAGHRGLVAGFVALLAVVVVAAVVILFTGNGTDRTQARSDSTSDVSPSSMNQTTRPADTSPDAPGTTSRPEATTSAGAVTLQLTMSARPRRFCDTVDIRIEYDAPTAHVMITDDADRELWQGPWPTGKTRTIELIAPSDELHASVTTRADPDSFKPSGFVHGSFC